MEQEITMNEVDQKILGYLYRASAIIETCDEIDACETADLLTVAKMIHFEESRKQYPPISIPYSKEER